MISVRDFANQQGCGESIIYRHIRNHKTALGDRVQKSHGKTWLTDEGAEYIRGLMKQQPLVVSEGDPRVAILEAEKKELEAQLREANAAFQKYVSETTSLLVKASQQIELAEKSEAYKKKSDELEAQNGVLKADNDKKDELLLQAEKTAQELSNELTEEKNRAISFKEYWKRRK